MILRGYVTLLAIALEFLIGDLTVRTIIPLLIKVRPSSRRRMLGAWGRFAARTVLATVARLGGAVVNSDIRVKAEPGILFVMNHQSLIDIPLIYTVFDGDYPKIVTRERYASGIPMVSPMLRLYRYPLVSPGREAGAHVEGLRDLAATTTHPLVIFPEGSRTRDGEISPFRTAGLEAILSSRRWKVYLVVIDGVWQCARLKDFVSGIGSVKVGLQCMGPFDFPRQGEDTGAFIGRMRELMCDKLQEMRGPHERQAAN